MDITFNPVSASVRPAQIQFPAANLPAAASATSNNSVSITPQQHSSAQAAAPQTESDTSYTDAIHQLAQSFKNDYAVSDKEFTIFKDAAGKYITRYVSLRDGSVTYVPSLPAVVRPPVEVNNSVTLTA